VSTVTGSVSCHYRRETLNGCCGIERRFQEMPGIFSGIPLLEYGAACDQDLGAGTHDLCDSLVMDAAVDFNPKVELARLPDIREQLNFLKARMDKGLATEAGVHAHDQNMMNQRKNLIEGVDRCGRVYDHSGLTSVGCDQMKGAIEMDAGFLVDGDPIRAGFGENGDEFVRPFNHEMTIEGDFRDFAKRRYYRGPDRDIRDEVTIHNVHVENGGSPFDSGLGFRAEAGEVSRQDGGSELDHRSLQLADRACCACGCSILSIIRSRIFSRRRKPTGRGLSLLWTTGNHEMPRSSMVATATSVESSRAT